MNNFLKLILLGGAGIMPMAAQTVNATASLQGVVTDGPKPVANVHVTYARELAKAGDPTPMMLGVLTDANGQFRFSGLMAGSYVLCAVANPDLSLVPTCKFTMSPQRVTVGSGQAVTGVKIAMDKGHRLDFRVDDPFQLLSTPNIPNPSKSVYVGVQSAERLVHGATLDSRDALGLNYYMIVPHGKPLTAKIQGQGVDVLDAKGLQADQSVNAKNGFTLQPGDGPVRLGYSVVHKRAAGK